MSEPALKIEADPVDAEKVLRVFPTEIGADTKKRIIEGVLVPYGKPTLVHDHDASPPYYEEYVPGVFRSNVNAANRVLLDFEHYGATNDIVGSMGSLQGTIGHGIGLREESDHLHGSFKILQHPDGDKALELAEAGVLAAFSVAARLKRSQRSAAGVVQRLNARLDRVSLCRTGAYPEAIVTAIRQSSGSEQVAIGALRDVIASLRSYIDSEPDSEDAAVAREWLSQAEALLGKDNAEKIPAAARTRTTLIDATELPPVFDLGLAEKLRTAGLEVPDTLAPTALRAFTEQAWDGSESRWDTAEAYCSACLVDNNPAGQPKTKDQCHFPYKEPGSGDVNVNALRAIVGGRGSQADFPGAATAQEKARRLLAQANSPSGQTARLESLSALYEQERQERERAEAEARKPRKIRVERDEQGRPVSYVEE